MKSFPKPNQVIELDLQKVAKQSIYLTLLSLLGLLAILFYVEGAVFFKVSGIGILVLSIGYILLVILHEFFHLLGFRIFANVPWNRMKVGVDFKKGIAYATTDQLMTNRAIRPAILLPFWMTGLLPAVIGLFMQSGLLIVLAAPLIGGAVGDFAMYRALKRLPDDWLVSDDPKLPRLHVFDPKSFQ